MKKSVILLSFFIFVAILSYSRKVNIIPQPTKVELQKGKFTLSNCTQVILAPGSDLHRYLQSQVQVLTKMDLDLATFGNIKTSTIKLTLDTNLNTGNEGYEMEVTKTRCEIKSKTETGLFYGIQSLLQLLPSKAVTKCEIPCLKICDSPRFEWRGMHLDVSRHFFPKEFIFMYLDLLALHKMNVFHWHLVDDQGWRIEIKRYPKLTEIGAWRIDDTDKPWNYIVNFSNDRTKKLYGGFYTQSDIREIVRYAAQRQIVIVPEIEMPGHSAALLEAYPALSCSGKQFRVDPENPWAFSDPVCPGNDYTFEFLQNVLIEVIDLFPGKYIHIGGDECKKTTWEKCPKCQARMKSENFMQVEQLQSYLIRRIEKFLISKNRQLIGWDEILEGGLAPEATVMSWRGTKGGIEAARLNHDVIMTPSPNCYFDFAQISGLDQPQNLPIDKVYAFDPIDKTMTDEEAKHVLGGQACVWTERMNTTDKVEEMVIPRICAMSEALWSDENQRNYLNFTARLDNFYLRLKALNYNVNVPDIIGMDSDNLFSEKTKVDLKCSSNDAVIHYTTDGTEPNEKSKIYKKAICITKETTLKAMVKLPSGYEGKPITGKFRPTTLTDDVKVDNLQSGLKYTYYEGVLPSIDSLRNLEPLKIGTISKFEFPENCSELNFAVKYEGYIQIEKPGIYTFYTSSDDGSILYVAEQRIVNNDGTHASQERKGQIALKAGLHPICAIYNQGGGGKSFWVSMQTPDGGKIEIPASVLKYK